MINNTTKVRQRFKGFPKKVQKVDNFCYINHYNAKISGSGCINMIIAPMHPERVKMQLKYKFSEAVKGDICHKDNCSRPTRTFSTMIKSPTLILALSTLTTPVLVSFLYFWLLTSRSRRNRLKSSNASRIIVTTTTNVCSHKQHRLTIVHTSNDWQGTNPQNGCSGPCLSNLKKPYLHCRVFLSIPHIQVKLRLVHCEISKLGTCSVSVHAAPKPTQVKVTAWDIDGIKKASWPSISSFLFQCSRKSHHTNGTFALQAVEYKIWKTSFLTRQLMANSTTINQTANSQVEPSRCTGSRLAAEEWTGTTPWPERTNSERTWTAQTAPARRQRNIEINVYNCNVVTQQQAENVDCSFTLIPMHSCATFNVLD